LSFAPTASAGSIRKWRGWWWRGSRRKRSCDWNGWSRRIALKNSA
jgi:hypothetical protein